MTSGSEAAVGTLARILAALAIAAVAAQAEIKEVTSPQELKAALAGLRPGTTLRLHPGEYGSGFSIRQIAGTADQPIVIEAAQPRTPPCFTGGSVALHAQGCAHLTLRHLKVQGQTGNGLNLDDAGSPAHHITLEGIEISEVGPIGNCDGIKLSGLTDFAVRNCRISGWGGEGVDMVGCHRGLVAGCHFEGKPGFSQATGVQTKGGSESLTIRGCTFVNAGQRAAQLGGSTGRPYFRPADAHYEARSVTLEGCLVVGGMTPVAFAGVDGAVVQFNTFLNPTIWALRILQENQEPHMIACRNGRFENNVIVIDAGDLRTWINIGPGAHPGGFTFAGNWWYHRGDRQPAKPALPSPESKGSYGIDPQLDPADGYKPRVPAAQSRGHTAWRPS